MSKHNAVSIVILFAVILSVGGCNGGSGGSATRPVQYPSTWPIKTLTAPAGVKQIPLFDLYDENPANIWEVNGEVVNQGSVMEHARWEICFEPGMPGKDVADHVDSCLKPLGFRLYKDGTPPQDRRMYISKDNKFQVNLDFMDLKPIVLTGKPGWKGYRLTTSVYPKPRPDITSTKPIP